MNVVKRAGPRTKLQLKDVDSIDEPRAANIDPMWLQWMSLTQDALPGDAHPGTGFLSYSMLRAMARVPPVAAIHKTRQNQAADFARQQPRPGAIGWRVSQKDKNKKPSRASEKNIRQIAEVIQRAGGQYYLGGFEAFIRTTVADSLTVDQVNAELIFTKGGIPWGFIPVDPATIRRKAPTHVALSDNRWDYQEQSYIQVIQNEIVNEFSHDELMWGIRNPRSLVYAAGYGHPELENLVGIITAYINTMTYNTTRYTVGTHADYMLALYSKDTREKADGLRRLMESGQSGVRGSRRNLVLQLNKSLDESVEAITLPRSQMTTQDAMWLDGLVEDICAHYAIDPSEINHVRKSNQGAPPDLSKVSPSDRVFMSKERGLRPLLRSIAQWLNYWVVEPYWPDYEFDFVGFDAQSERERMDFLAKSVSLWMSPNEARAEQGLPLLDDPVSNMPLHGSYAAYLQRAAADGLEGTDPGPLESFDDVGSFLDGVRMPVADEPA